MKTEFIDVSETQKNLVVEIPSSVVDAEIDRIARDYSRAVRIPGFRPGKVPQKIVRQRFRDRILHDVAHDLIPKAIDEALRERGQEPVDTPDIRDVSVQEGQPLRFTAAFETVPPVDPGDYRALSLRRPPVALGVSAVEEAMAGLQRRMARFEPVEDRPAGRGDAVTLDMQRVPLGRQDDPADSQGEPTTHEQVTVEIGGEANPPGLDAELTGLNVGDHKSFVLTYPDDYASEELAGTRVQYSVEVRAIKRTVLPELDDEFAKAVGAFESLEALKDRVREDLLGEAERDADREVRSDLATQLAGRVRFPLPASLVDREIDRRVEEFVRRLLEQQIDPTRMNINWEQFRERQRDAALQAVRTALVLDEVARREGLTVTDEDISREVARYAERTGKTTAAVRARIEKEGGIARLHAGLRREKAIDFLLSHATITVA